MSHHLDSPLSRRDPRLNLTDTYVFDGTSGTTFVMVVNSSLAGDGHKPGFHPEARYEFRIHLDGDARESLAYRFTFGDREQGSQAFSLSQLSGGDAGNDAATGHVLAEGRTGQSVQGNGDAGVRVWAGAAADPFYLDLHHLSFVLRGLQNQRPIEYDDWTASTAASSFSNSFVYVIVLEVPATDASLSPGREIGVWAATKLATDAGGWRQINRAAIPMMWPLFRAIGGNDDSEHYHHDTESVPADDLANDGDRIIAMVEAAARFSGTEDPASYAHDVVNRLLPDLLPYTVGTSAHFGFAGFNGRRLADNAPEVMYSLVTNTGFPTGLTSESAAKTRSEGFPYIVPSQQDD